MKLYVLDTDTVSHLRNRHPVVTARSAVVPASQKFITIITVEEQIDGWYALLRKPVPKARVLDAYTRLAETVRYYGVAQLLTLSEAAFDRADRLHKQKLNVKKNDLRIAAIALEHSATVVTANVRDFARIPGLLVEDLTQPAP